MRRRTYIKLTPMPSTVIYTRISSDREDTGAGVGRQKADCLAYAQQSKLNVHGIIEDNDTSAYNRSKPRRGWNQVKELVRSGTVDSILVWHTDRLYRHPSDLEDIIELVDGRDLTIHTVTAGELDLNTATGRMVARLLGSVARNEVEHKSERQSRKHLDIAQTGKWHGGIVPTGYRRTENKGELVIDDLVAELIQEAAQRILKGHSLAATTRWYREETGREIKPQTLKGILTGPTVAGLRMHIPQGDRNRWARERAIGNVSGDLPDKMGIYEATWDAILDRQAWHDLRSILLDPNRRNQGKRPEKSLLSGLLRCGRCDKPLNYSSLTYKCSQNAGGCGRLGISTKAIEGHILDLVEELIRINDINIPAAVVQPKKDSEPDWESKRADLLDLFREGIVTRSELTRQLNQIDSRTAEARAEDDRYRREEVQVQQILSAVREWETADLPQRRGVIAALIESIVISPAEKGPGSGPKLNTDRAEVRWRYGKALRVAP